MPDLCITINGIEVRVVKGTTVAAAMLQVGVACRISVSGEARTALCGMGICFECRATVDGVPHRTTCQLQCVEGMTAETMR
ncbi:2Fe-2S iron-sulfur cluster-binding protein [Granulicella tundricola]|uniref:FAD-dependent pyridine nucleotide-disulfide oxidoreductase n=1 Tax=Granulicella tundricola (strain ATCC BAA-1859 / DSM 23138 / MP5ACTX9) TaxID=1198114 RepID=E8X6E0_GRATM|nr:2Fe-2S iron-sulfur cluster-binding protein [Granulicella tundricola]ADW71024.1 FAD-dependent pyridine nucleotide-disulfide oxidoreductase [Granulicella tundricola MP5ACTX9]